MDPSETQGKYYANNGEVMLGSSILVFIIVIIVVFFHTFCHSCTRRRSRRRSGIRTDSSVAFNQGLNPSVLNSLPTFTYSSASVAHRPLHDCAVCLSEFTAGEQGRILPNCNHAFHSHCIDTWFRSHSNCPLCRTPVEPPRTGSSNTEPGSAGFSSFLEPVGCPRKSLELVGIVVELEGGRVRNSESGRGTGLSRVETSGVG